MIDFINKLLKTLFLKLHVDKLLYVSTAVARGGGNAEKNIYEAEGRREARSFTAASTKRGRADRGPHVFDYSAAGPHRPPPRLPFPPSFPSLPPAADQTMRPCRRTRKRRTWGHGQPTWAPLRCLRGPFRAYDRKVGGGPHVSLS